MGKKVGIVTVLYNSETVLNDFFETLELQSFRNFVLYVVDNNSPDKSLYLAELLSKKVSFETKFIPCVENYGVAKGNNLGVRQALIDQCDYILLSNNDVVIDSYSIDKLVNGLEQHNVDIVVPKIYYYGSDLIWAAGGYFNKFSGTTVHIGNLKKDSELYNCPCFIDYSPTCFMLIKAEVFEIVGTMDEKYFVYYDDTDFSYRCLKRGVKLFYIPSSLIYHKESTSVGKNSPFQRYYLVRNLIYFSKKNYNFINFLLIVFLIVFKHLVVHVFNLDRITYKIERMAIVNGIKMAFNGEVIQYYHLRFNNE